MKKIYLITLILISTLIANKAYSRTDVYKCMKFHNFISYDGSLITSVYDENDNDSSLVLISEKRNDDTQYVGKITTIYKDRKSEYLTTDFPYSTSSAVITYKAIRWSIVDDETLSIYDESFKKTLKKNKGNFYSFSSLELEVDTESNIGILEIIDTNSLVMLGTMFERTMEAYSMKFLCKKS